MNKPTVKYRKSDAFIPNIGGRAYLYVYDHPEFGEQEVTTSTIVSHDTMTGAVETLNTVYVPA